jgi:hypothetical protein
MMITTLEEQTPAMSGSRGDIQSAMRVVQPVVTEVMYFFME